MGETFQYRGTSFKLPKIPEELLENKSKTAIYNLVANQLAETGKIINVHETDELWVLEDEEIWKNKGNRLTRKYAVESLPLSISKNGINQITEVVKGKKLVDIEELGAPKSKIPVKNGLLELETLELEEIKPEHYTTYRHPVKYDEDAECPRFKQFLENMVDNHGNRKKLQEIAGYTLLHWGYPYHKFFIIVGPTASGKSTFLKIIDALHENDQVSSVSLKKLVDNRFAGAQLFQKTVNINNDLPPSAIYNTGYLKQVTGDDTIWAEQKHKDGFDFENKAKLIYACNQTPIIERREDAVHRRGELIPFPYTIPNNDPDEIKKCPKCGKTTKENKCPDCNFPLIRKKQFEQKIIENELPGILNWAIQGYKRLIEQNGFTNEQTPKETEEKLLKWGKPLYRFLDRKCVFEGEAWTPVENIVKNKKTFYKGFYKAYTDFCIANRTAAESKRKVTKGLQKVGVEKRKKRIPELDGNRKECYFGIKLKENIENKKEINKTNKGEDKNIQTYSDKHQEIYNIVRVQGPGKDLTKQKIIDQANKKEIKPSKTREILDALIEQGEIMKQGVSEAGEECFYST